MHKNGAFLPFFPSTLLISALNHSHYLPLQCESQLQCQNQQSEEQNYASVHTRGSPNRRCCLGFLFLTVQSNLRMSHDLWPFALECWLLQKHCIQKSCSNPKAIFRLQQYHKTTPLIPKKSENPAGLLTNNTQINSCTSIYSKDINISYNI